mmetsp:Transcript_25694/g.59462  ORF Transcript_25694/g.59462 Transcript_25694/m.59462 type:complete len:453 (-) Transcript_25694:236-1594(-)
MAAAFKTSCKLSNWMGLGKCKHGVDQAGCAEAYSAWFDAGCLCDYAAYPWGFLPKDITPIGFTWALMQTNTPRTYSNLSAIAPCLEKPSDCEKAREGDVRLDIYGHGSLLLFHDSAWRRVLGRLSNATALSQCARLGFEQGYVLERDYSLESNRTDDVVLVEDCLPAEPLEKCARRSRRIEDVAGPVTATRLSCHSVGPAACFVDRYGDVSCVQDTLKFDKDSAPPKMPSMACGTAGTKFLERASFVPPSALGSEHPLQAGCLSLFDDAQQRCIVSPDASGEESSHAHQDREVKKLCSSSCEDSLIQVIRREDCFDVNVSSAWGKTYGAAVRAHAETVYSHCGEDLWQSAALSADTNERCVALLLEMFHRCQEESERHLCSDSCAVRVDVAMAAVECYSVHYYRGEPKAYRGHVTLLSELRERVCKWSPPLWSDDDSALFAAGGSYFPLWAG